MSAKRTAMENATKNAGLLYFIIGEMIQRLTLKYNRTRQATITNDLLNEMYQKPDNPFEVSEN